MGFKRPQVQLLSLGPNRGKANRFAPVVFLGSENMQGTQIRDFTKGNITKQLLTFAFPLFLSNLLQVVYNMVDMAIVGHVLGKTGTSAVSVGGDISVLLTFVGIGFGNAGQVLIARYIGAKEQNKIGKFVGTMCGFLMVCAVVISILGIVFQDKFLSLMNTPPESLAGATSYSIICMTQNPQQHL